jgi:hypothetical protein
MASSRTFLVLGLYTDIKMPTEYTQFVREIELVWGIIHTTNIIHNQRVQYQVYLVLCLKVNRFPLTIATYAAETARNESMSIFGQLIVGLYAY